MNKLNLNIKNQCPQLYLYILAVVTSILITLKFGTKKEALTTIIFGLAMTIILMGVDFCNWPFQWLTWILAALWLIVAFGNIFIMFLDDEEYKKLNEPILQN